MTTNAIAQQLPTAGARFRDNRKDNIRTLEVVTVSEDRTEVDCMVIRQEYQGKVTEFTDRFRTMKVSRLMNPRYFVRVDATAEVR